MNQRTQKNYPRQSLKSEKNREQRNSFDHVYGKVPPHATDLEKVVLGAIMLERDGFRRVADLISAGAFYSEAHQLIFEAMQDLSKTGQAIDILTVAERLQKNETLDKVGGPYYVTLLTHDVVSAAHIENHCRIILEKYIKREVIRVGGEMIQSGYADGTDGFELLDDSEFGVLDIRRANIRKQFNTLDAVMVKNIGEIEQMRHRDEHLSGVPSGFPELDNVTCGWQKTDLIILAARPSVGKTAFALNLARNAAMDPQKPTPVGFFSLEMSDTQLVNRILAAESQIWLWKIRNARIDDDGMKQLYRQGVQPLAQAKIFIDDTPSLNINEFRSKARSMVVKYNVGIIIVDYLQLMTVTNVFSREQQVAEISRQLKATAKELNIPVIALAQMSRDVEKRGTNEPQLSDLRESGSIEQDADVVGFLYRPHDEEIKQDASLQLVCYVSIKKNRNGDLAKFIGEFQKEIQKWNFLKVVDPQTLKPLGNSWLPVPNLPSAWRPVGNVRNYNEPISEQDNEDF